MPRPPRKSVKRNKKMPRNTSRNKMPRINLRVRIKRFARRNSNYGESLQLMRKYCGEMHQKLREKYAQLDRESRVQTSFESYADNTHVEIDLQEFLGRQDFVSTAVTQHVLKRMIQNAHSLLFCKRYHWGCSHTKNRRHSEACIRDCKLWNDTCHMLHELIPENHSLRAQNFPENVGSENFNRDIHRAVKLHHMHGGLLEQFEGTIGDNLSASEHDVHSAMKNFCDHVRVNYTHCGGCGNILDLNNVTCTELELGDADLSSFIVDDERRDVVEQYTTTSAANTLTPYLWFKRHSLHVVEHESNVYALHPKTIIHHSDKPKVCLCQGCHPVENGIPRARKKKHWCYHVEDPGVPFYHLPWSEYNFEGEPLTLDDIKLSSLNELAISRAFGFIKVIRAHNSNHSKTDALGKLVSHTYTHPLDSSEMTTIKDRFSVNTDAVRFFDMLFIGEKTSTAFWTLHKSKLLNRHIKCDSKKTARALMYLHACRESITSATSASEIETCITPDLQSIEKNAKEKIINNNHPATMRLTENLPNDEDASTGLITSTPNIGETKLQQCQGVSDLCSDLLASSDPETKAANDKCVSILCESIEKDSGENSASNVATSRLGDCLMNEYTQNHSILSDVFPLLFPRGWTDRYKDSKTFQQYVLPSLLLNKTDAYETNHSFLFMSLSQKLRCDAAIASKHVLTASTESVKIFKQLYEDENIIRSLEILKSFNPKTDKLSPHDEERCKDARKFLEAVKNVVTKASSQMPWTPGERKAELGNLYGMVYQYGLPSLFLTVNANGDSGGFTVDMSTRGNGTEASAQATWDTTTFHSRRSMADKHPATKAYYFDKIARAIIEDLTGIRLANVKLRGTNKTRVAHVKGLFGTVKAIFSVTEAQGRGSLHMHILIWSKETSPILASRHIHNKENHDKICKAIDACIHTHLPQKFHDLRTYQDKKLEYYATEIQQHLEKSSIHIERKTIWSKLIRCSPQECWNALVRSDNGKSPPFPNISPLPDYNPAEIKKFEDLEKDLQRVKNNYPKFPSNVTEANELGQKIACTCQIHKHSCRCRKLPRGLHHCAMHRPEKHNIKNTKFQKLELDPQDVDLPKNKRGICISDIIDNPPDLRPEYGYPCGAPDHRHNAITHERGPDDGYVVEHNRILSAIVRCNTCAIQLANAASARCTLYYLSDYLTKNPLKLVEAYPLISCALKRAKQFESKAPDRLTDARNRFSKYALQKILNTITQKEEYSTEQAAAALLNMQSRYSSDTFDKRCAWDAVSTLRKLASHEKNLPLTSNMPQTFDNANHESDCNEHEQTEDCRDTDHATDFKGHDDTVHNELHSKTGFTTPVLGIGGNLKFVSPVTHYLHRPRELALLSLYEFWSLISVKRKKKLEDGSFVMPKSKRKISSRWEFPHDPSNSDNDHPQQKTHYLQLRTQFHVVSFVGPARPNYNSFKKDANKFCSYYAALFVPWFKENSEFSTILGARSAQFYYDPVEFCSLMRQWSAPNAPALLRARYYQFYNMVHNSYASYDERLVAEKFGYMTADRWKDMDASKVPRAFTHFAHKGTNSTNVLSMDLQAAHERLELEMQIGLLKSNRHRFLHYVTNVFKTKIETGIAAGMELEPAPIPHSHPVGKRYTVKWCDNQIANLLSKKQPTAVVSSTEKNTRTPPGKFFPDILEKFEKPLRGDQPKAYRFITTSILRNTHKLFFLQADAGIGKSFLSKQIHDALAAHGIKSIAGAAQWSTLDASPLTCEKLSIHSLLGGLLPTSNSNMCKMLHENRLFNHNKIEKIRKIFHEVEVIFIDEFSQLGPELLVALNVGLQKAFNNTNEPFAGKYVIAIGDMKQIQPVGSFKNLAEMSMAYGLKADPTKPHETINYLAADLFTSFRLVTLSGDAPRFTCSLLRAMLSRFSLSRKPNDNQPPLRETDLIQLHRFNTALFTEKKKKKFLDARWLVQTNFERFIANKLLLFAFAKRRNQQIYRWVEQKKKEFSWEDQQDHERRINGGAVELEYFWTVGMPVVFAEHMHGTKKWQHLSKDRTGRAVSLAWKDSDPDFHFSPHETPTYNAEGDIVPVKVKPPAFYIIDLDPIPGDKSSTPRRIPVPPQWTQQHLKYFHKHAPQLFKDQYPKDYHVDRIYAFPIVPLFCVTFNKVQGQTLLIPVVLVLTNLTLHGQPRKLLDAHKLFVGLSRVCKLDDIAILGTNLKYLTTLDYSDFLKAWIKNYDRAGMFRKAHRFLPKALKIMRTLAENQTAITDPKLTLDTTLKPLAKALGITTSRTNKKELCQKLRPIYKEYLDTFHSTMPDRPASSVSTTGQKRTAHQTEIFRTAKRRYMVQSRQRKPAPPQHHLTTSRAVKRNRVDTSPDTCLEKRQKRSTSQLPTSKKAEHFHAHSIQKRSFLDGTNASHAVNTGPHQDFSVAFSHQIIAGDGYCAYRALCRCLHWGTSNRQVTDLSTYALSTFKGLLRTKIDANIGDIIYRNMTINPAVAPRGVGTVSDELRKFCYNKLNRWLANLQTASPHAVRAADTSIYTDQQELVLLIANLSVRRHWPTYPTTQHSLILMSDNRDNPTSRRFTTRAWKSLSVSLVVTRVHTGQGYTVNFFPVPTQIMSLRLEDALHICAIHGSDKPPMLLRFVNSNHYNTSEVINWSAYRSHLLRQTNTLLWTLSDSNSSAHFKIFTPH